MVTMTIQVRGMRRSNKTIQNLGKEIKKEILNKSQQFIRFVQKSAKLRAPRHSGDLARSIRVFRKGDTISLVVESPYGLYQDRGFRPHWIHALLPSKNKFGTVGAALNIAGFIKVSKHTPFITPALEAGLSRLPNMLADGASTGIKNAQS